MDLRTRERVPHYFRPRAGYVVGRPIVHLGGVLKEGEQPKRPFRPDCLAVTRE